MKRPWFRIHLSTAVLVMLAGSVLLWASMREVEVRDRLAVNQSDGRYIERVQHCYGWPFTANGIQVISLGNQSPGVVIDLWEPKYMAANIAVALLILALLAALCEWRIRRKTLPPSEGRADVSEANAAGIE